MNDSIGLIGSKMSRYPQSGGKKPRLFDQVRQKIQALHYSPRTGKTYIGWIKRFILFHGKRHPLEMGEKEINEFLSFAKFINSISKMVSAMFICLMLFHENILMLQENGIGNMYFLHPNDLEILIQESRVGIISMKQQSRNLQEKP